MEKLVIKNQDSFKLKDIFECGQCFRWEPKEDGSYIGIIKEGVLRVYQDGNTITFEGNLEGDFKEIVYNYFDLNTDYNIYKQKLSKVDKYMKESICYGDGIRILKQDLWETIISFIISANNNIPRIKKIIGSISKKYGKKVEFEGQDYFLFPTVEELSKATVEELRSLGTGFRDIRIFNTTRMIKSKKVDLDYIKSLDDSSKIEEELLKLDGVGPKVADCIMLFALKREDVFPIDVWVRRVMNDLYIHNEIEEKVSKKEINKIAKEKFGNLSAIAQQYLFYWKREEGK